MRFRPHVLRDTSRLSLATTVLGTPVASPVLVAPMAQQRAAHPEGEVATARAVRRRGTLLGRLHEHRGAGSPTSRAVGAPWWFQVYVMDDRAITADLVQRRGGGGRVGPRADRRRTRRRPAPAAARAPDLARALRHAGEPAGRRHRATVFSRHPRTSPSTTSAGCTDLTGLPVVVKGVLRADDAARCVDAGAAGVVVSTHGGRCLTQSIGSADALPEVVAAVGDRAEVYVDSGLRTPEHVAAALCLGARAVFLGRPVLWALATGGDAGVEELLAGFDTQLERVLRSLGAGSLDDLGPDLVV